MNRDHPLERVPLFAQWMSRHARMNTNRKVAFEHARTAQIPNLLSQRTTTGRYQKQAEALLRKLSLKRRLALVFLLTTSAGLLFASATILCYEMVRFRHESVRELGRQADIIAAVSAPALAHGDHRTIDQALAALKTQPGILQAWFCTPEGRRVAECKTRSLPQALPSASSHTANDGFGHSALAVYRPVVLDHQMVGGVFLQADGRQQTGRVLGYASIVMVALLSGLFVSLLVSLWLQRVVISPISELVRLTQLVSRDADYSLRASENTSDEIGALARGFNQMLARVQLRERLILEISDREQERLGQDLHDGLCQQLLSAGLKLAVVKKELGAETHPAVEPVNHALGLLDQAVGQARLLSRELYPLRLETDGLVPTLEELATKLALDNRITCLVECPEPVLIGDHTRATHAYRIAQEALINALKHAQPNSVIMRLAPEGDLVRLTITDDGTGIQIPASGCRGMGLHIMNYRARALGGTLVAERGRKGGTIVSCSFPKAP
jgi:signal transduction histidine kinase